MKNEGASVEKHNTVGQNSEMNNRHWEECRACLGRVDTQSAFNLFEPWITPWALQEAVIADDLSKFADVEISESDDYPKLICKKCHSRLSDACKFMITVQMSDNILRKRAKPRNPTTSQAGTSWPQPILLNKSQDMEVDKMIEVEVKQEVLSDDENGDENGADIDQDWEPVMDIKIEPEEISIPVTSNAQINGVPSETSDEINLNIIRNSDSRNGDNLNAAVKEEPPSEDDLLDGTELPLDCILCFKVFNTISGLKAHVISEHSYKTVKRKAGGCPSPAKSKIQVKEYTCKSCDQSFKTSTDLMVHRASHAQHVCYTCDRKFGSFQQLMRHTPRCQKKHTMRTRSSLRLQLLQPERNTMETQKQPTMTETQKLTQPLKNNTQTQIQPTKMEQINIKSTCSMPSISQKLPTRVETPKPSQPLNNSIKTQKKVDDTAATKHSSSAIDDMAATKPTSSTVGDMATTKSTTSAIDNLTGTKPTSSVIDDMAASKHTGSAIENMAATKPTSSAIDNMSAAKPTSSAIDDTAATKLASSAIDDMAATKLASSAIDDMAATKPTNSSTDDLSAAKSTSSAIDNTAATKLASSAIDELAAIKPTNSAIDDMSATKLKSSVIDDTAATKPTSSAIDNMSAAKSTNSAIDDMSATKLASSAIDDIAATKSTNSAIDNMSATKLKSSAIDDTAATKLASSAIDDMAATKPTNSAINDMSATKLKSSAIDDTAATKLANSAINDMSAAKSTSSVIDDTAAAKPKSPVTDDMVVAVELANSVMDGMEETEPARDDMVASKPASPAIGDLVTTKPKSSAIDDKEAVPQNLAVDDLVAVLKNPAIQDMVESKPQSPAIEDMIAERVQELVNTWPSTEEMDMDIELSETQPENKFESTQADLAKKHQYFDEEKDIEKRLSAIFDEPFLSYEQTSNMGKKSSVKITPDSDQESKSSTSIVGTKESWLEQSPNSEIEDTKTEQVQNEPFSITLEVEPLEKIQKEPTSESPVQDNTDSSGNIPFLSLADQTLNKDVNQNSNIHPDSTEQNDSKEILTNSGVCIKETVHSETESHILPSFLELEQSYEQNKDDVDEINEMKVHLAINPLDKDNVLLDTETKDDCEKRDSCEPTLVNVISESDMNIHSARPE